MDGQPRGSEMPRGGGIRKFMNDPKSSVMSYLAENMAAQHLQQQQQQSNHGSSGQPTSTSSYGQHYNNQGSGGLSSQLQSHSNVSQSSLAPSPAGQNGVVPPAFSPQSSTTQIAQNAQSLPVTPYIASNAAASSGQLPEVYSGAPTSDFPPQQHSVQLQKQDQIQGSEISMTNLGKMPPTSGSKHSNMSQSAPRLYHRMVLDFEVAKNLFFKAKAQHNSQEMTSAAYDLESLSRRIWSLRFEHAWEFDGFQEPGHQAVIASWQAQYELWADTVLDIQEGDSAASMFTVQRTSSIGGNAAIEAPAMNMMAPASGMSSNDGYGQLHQPTFSDIPITSAGQAPARVQQLLNPQPMSIGQTMPINQVTQSPPTPPQYMPPNSMPGGYTSASMPPPENSVSQQPTPFQQQSFSPPPQQVGIGQNVPPSVGPGAPSGQNMPPNTQSNMQQRPPQGPFPQQMPPQRSPPPQQIAGGPSNMQQLPYMNQRPPPAAPNSNGMSLPPISQMPPGQSPSPRPNLNKPQSLQPGGR